jgi:hypothetical protein
LKLFPSAARTFAGRISWLPLAVWANRRCRTSAIRKLAVEATDGGLLAP